MPELPEVETIARRLAAHLIGATITGFHVHHPKLVQQPLSNIVGTHITAIERRAKILRFRLSNDLNILIHLKMTGQLILLVSDGQRLGGGHPTSDWVLELPSKHTRASFDMLTSKNEAIKLFFNDMRLFGWIRVLSNDQVLDEYSKYGPDILDPVVTPAYFFAQLSRTKRPIKLVLLDPSIIAGVGNIYACDALHLANIHPQRSAQTLTESESNAVLASAVEVIQLGIELQGATIHSYSQVDGLAGGYQHRMRVYGKAGQPCGVCATLIEKYALSGRGTYFCPQCQV